MSEAEMYVVTVAVYTQDRTNRDIAKRVERALEEDFLRAHVMATTKGPEDE